MFGEFTIGMEPTKLLSEMKTDFAQGKVKTHAGSGVFAGSDWGGMFKNVDTEVYLREDREREEQERRENIEEKI
jgi:hypothetical protein